MATRTLDSPPSLAPLYAKAALGPLIPGGGGEEAPDLTLVLPAAGVDPVNLADYCRVCGFALRETLPLTYPHILGFPLQMSLMTERSFPFGLLGLVHIENRIEQLRPIGVTEVPAVRVRAENLRPHEKGQAIDLVTETEADGDPVWREQSTYLRPGEGDGPDADEGQDPLVGAEQSAVINVPGDIGRRYAEVSGDRNPIHLHPLAAKPFGFPTAIAHGMWTLARTLAALEGRLPEALVAEARFRSPVRIPGRVALMSRRTAEGWNAGLQSPDGERRHLEVAIREGGRGE